MGCSPGAGAEIPFVNDMKKAIGKWFLGWASVIVCGHVVCAVLAICVVETAMRDRQNYYVVVYGWGCAVSCRSHACCCSCFTCVHDSAMLFMCGMCFQDQAMRHLHLHLIYM